MNEEYLKTPLHITWMNETMVYLEKMVLSNPKLKPLFRDRLEAGTIRGCSPKSPDEANLLVGLNLFFSAKNAQEVVVEDTGEIVDLDNWDLKTDFDPPFEDMIINLYSKGEGYHPMFIQLFKLDEDYIDSEGSSPVYIAKTMTKSDKPGTGIPTNYKAICEMIIIKSKLPRVIFPSYISEVCRTCNIATETNMMEKVYGHANEGVRYCLKTIRTCNNCRIVSTEFEHPVPHSTFAYLGFSRLKFITNVLKRLNTPPETVLKTSVERKLRTYDRQDRSVYVDHSQRSYIEIKEVKNVYDTPESDSRPHGSHASPCEHKRKKHFRKLRSGKVIEVKASIINEGKPKPIYILKGKMK